MRKYNSKIASKIAGVIFVIIGIYGALYYIFAATVDFGLAQDYQKVFPDASQEDMIFVLKDLFLVLFFLALTTLGFHKLIQIFKFYRMKKIIGQRELVPLDELAKKLHTSKGKVRREIEKMIQHNFFLQGHINQEFTCFITTDWKYQQYLQVIKAWKEEQKKWEARGFDEEKRKIVEKAQHCLEQIQQSIDVISKKNQGMEIFQENLEKLEGKVKNLLSVCNHNPENLPEMSMFLNYYLPTAEKFVKEYEQLSEYETLGTNMEILKKDIIEGVGELSNAFDQIAMRMCDKMEIDIVQDIQALEVLMEQNRRKGA